MSAATVTPPPATRPAAPSRPRPATYGTDPTTYRLTPDQYDRMVEVGILGMADKVELLEGYLVTKMPPNPPHSGTVHRVSKRLRRHLPAGWEDRTQSPVRLPDSRPEPDVAVIRERADDYRTQHPTPPDIGLLIEVSDSSLALDQRDKARLYAEAGIPHYWIVNLPDQRVEVYSAPAAASYPAPTLYAAGDLVPLVLDGVTVAHVPAADLLP